MVISGDRIVGLVGRMTRAGRVAATDRTGNALG
jgi:hypothetical protein